MVDPLPFMVPNYGSRGAKWLMWIGFFLYDLLAFDRKWLKDEDKQLPGHKSISAKQALEMAPGLNPEGLIGGVIYFDCQMYAPERLCVECIQEASALGAHVANHAEATRILKQDDLVIGATVKDMLSGKSHDIKARLTINASGPWADYVLRSAEDDNPSRHLIRSKGIHVITRSLARDTALLIETDGNHVLFLPWRDHTIIGTTDSVFVEHPDKVSTTQEDIAGLMEKAMKAYPGANLSPEDVKHFYAGLRPLVDPDGNPDNNATQDTYGASRAAEIVDHAEESGTEGLLSAIGGKWTTSRHIAEQVIDKALTKLPDLPQQIGECASAELPTHGGNLGNFRSFVEDLKIKNPGFAGDIIENLAKSYGSVAQHVMKLCADDMHLKERLEPSSPFIKAEVVHVMKEEMAITLEDIVMRRCCIGTLGKPSDEILSNIVSVMNEVRPMTDAERIDQKEDLSHHFQTGAF